MDPKKSQDEISIIAALLHDIQMSYGVVFNNRTCRLTINQVNKRVRTEGLGFLTKTLPRLGKAFDKAIAGDTPLDCKRLGFKPYLNTKLPRFLGELFSCVLRQDGTLLPFPCVTSVRDIRQICYLFYKYELPYSHEQEQQVIQKFKRTEDELSSSSRFAASLAVSLETCNGDRRLPRSYDRSRNSVSVAREAKILLSRVFSSFDPRNILPRHGPGAVATRQRLSEKYLWGNVSSRITDMYPFDEYFCSSMGAVCDKYKSFDTLTEVDHPARVILVPKDSRGPRLISCEPVDFQWIQQGLHAAIVELIEDHPTTKWNVFFTDQDPNRRGALLGSSTGKYATLDLNEASDRVSLELVRLLFPPHICEYLEACRSSSTELPSGEVIKLQKFAPMGSALCFPILALTVWAILTAAAPDEDTKDRILVYGDDVIVPTAYAANAMEQLELFGLKVNRDKSCISGLFRESCGMDAFSGVNVTPVRFRTVWSSTPHPDVFSSWIAYANSCWDRQYYHVYDLIVERLTSIYGAIPGEDMHLACPSLRFVPITARPKHTRNNIPLQKKQYKVWDLKSPLVNQIIDGWSMLLRFFAESANRRPKMSGEWAKPHEAELFYIERPAFYVSQYTSRGTSMLVRRWR